MRRSMRWSGRVALALLFVGLGPAVAHGGNMTHPRTPVLWDGGGGECRLPVLQTPCMTLHDRTDGPLLFPYGIPYEDTQVGPEEVADSRRHQFFAFCRPQHTQAFLPTWIAETDVASAEAADLLGPDTVGPDNILELRADWDGCWYRFNADAERRPITCAMAEMGIEWDTTAVTPGVYTIQGYTYEPVFNLWWLRPGVVKVHDGDPDALGPAAAITTGELTPYRDDVVTIEGCVDALEGTTFTAYWAVVPDGEPEWIEHVVDQPVDGDSFAFELAPPPALVGDTGMIRVDFTDPMGRAYTSYMSQNIIVIDADNPEGCPAGGGFIGGPDCGDSGEGSSGSDGGSGSVGDESSSTAAAGDSSGTTSPLDEEPKGCGCRSAPPRGRGLGLGLLVLALRRRRRGSG